MGAKIKKTFFSFEINHLSISQGPLSKNCANCDKSMKFGMKVPKTNMKKMANGDELNFSFSVPIMTS